MKKLILFSSILTLNALFLIACDPDSLNRLFEPQPVAVLPETNSSSSELSSIDSSFELDPIDCSTALAGIDFDYELSPSLITDDFLVEVVHCKNIYTFLPSSFLISLNNGNEIAITLADQVVFLISYREQDNETANTQHPAWWSIALGTIDIRNNLIQWEGFVENINGVFVVESLSRNPISQ